LSRIRHEDKRETQIWVSKNCNPSGLREERPGAEIFLRKRTIKIRGSGFTRTHGVEAIANVGKGKSAV